MVVGSPGVTYPTRMAEPTFRDFDIILAERREAAGDKTGPTFQLGGQMFQCKNRLTGKAAIQLGRLTTSDDLGEVLDFIRRVLKKGQAEQLDAVLDDDDEGLYDIEFFGDLISYIVEGYSGRPTPESSDSSATS